MKLVNCAHVDAQTPLPTGRRKLVKCQEESVEEFSPMMMLLANNLRKEGRGEKVYRYLRSKGGVVGISTFVLGHRS